MGNNDILRQIRKPCALRRESQDKGYLHPRRRIKLRLVDHSHKRLLNPRFWNPRLMTVSTAWGPTRQSILSKDPITEPRQFSVKNITDFLLAAN